MVNRWKRTALLVAATALLVVLAATPAGARLAAGDGTTSAQAGKTLNIYGMGGRAMAAEALEMIGAGAEAAVEVERRDRAPRALPAGGALGDQHHRAVEALDEP